MSDENNYQEYLDELCGWAQDRGYFVFFERGGDNCICPVNKLIEINSKAPLKDQVYSLTHECGHALIIENGSFWDYSIQGKVPKNNKISSTREKVFTVIEEIEAWKRGYKLAIKLKIPINKEEWELEMTKAIKNYIDWAAS